MAYRKRTRYFGKTKYLLEERVNTKKNAEALARVIRKTGSKAKVTPTDVRPLYDVWREPRK